MAITHRTAARALELENSLKEEAHNYDLYAALRLIECLHPNMRRLGESLHPIDDPVRLTQTPSLAFAPTTLSKYFQASGNSPARLENLFFGLFGPNGPLPLHMTEYAKDRLHNADDPTLCRFADIFHHRMLSLFYRAKANTEPTINYDRPGEDRFLTYIGATCGYGMESMRNRDAMPDKSKLYHAGLLSNQTRSAEGLRTIIRNFFGLPVKILQFVGHWINLPEDSQLKLGATPDTGALGLTTILGKRIWDCQSRFRIQLGPMKLEDYKRLLPNGKSFERLVAIVKNYIGEELSWDVQLILEKDQVPTLMLGKSAQLGWTSWAKVKTFNQDADDLILDPSSCNTKN